VSVPVVSLFFATIALALAAFVVIAVVGRLVAASAVEPLFAVFRPVAYELATAVALGCMLGSLYMSEIANFKPCRLCWVQRGFMYPAAVLLLVGLLANRRWLFGRIALVLAALGLPVSIFHRVEEAVGGFGNVCEIDNPCSLKWIEEYGFVTIPTMAGIGFASIIVFVLLSADRRPS
jgi:Disulfide bond formation protein DsbB